MSKLKSVKEFIDSSGYFKIAVLVGIGLLLIFFGMGGGEAVSTGAEAKTLEEEVAELCSSLDGVGECRVLITYEEKSLGYGRGTEKIITGIAVVCSGGESAAVKERVTALLSGLFGIGANRIRVERLAGGV